MSIRLSLVSLLALTSALSPAQAQPQPVPFRVQLTQPLSTKANQKGDKVTAVVLEPAAFKGGILEGTVKEVKSGGAMTKESVLNFGFGMLHANGKDIPVRSDVTKFYNSKGQENADEEGRIVKKKNDLAKAALIAGLGAGIGAAAGGGKGAAIGAGAGMAAGLLFARFGCKAENIAFDTGSIFEVALSPRQQ